MGAYLSKPITEKICEEGEDDRLSFDASSMQGWRTSQEDAHSCILDFTPDSSLFAVYDGHGGAEVAQLCSERLPQFIKESDEFANGNISKALIDSFLAFDEVIITPEIQEVLLKLANVEDGKSNDADEEEDDDPSLLQEEAALPLAQLLQKYKLSIMDNDSEENSDEETKAEKEESDEGIVENSRTKVQGDGVKKVKESPDEVLEDDDDEEFVVGDEEEEEEGDSDDDEDDDEEEGESSEDMGSALQNSMGSMLQYANSSPGFDSGSTAVVAIIDRNAKKIYVANAGDSRCVLCRDGRALDLSVDHKPEDEIEKTRITAAGGVLSEDGRVNGGLNLSRSIGDHSYKKNSDLDLKDQMISALPDVKVVDLDPKDTFMVLACDGIWNTFSSEDLIDFIQKRLTSGMSPKDIIDEIFNHCLAPNTSGDGTGCDNMTCIIVSFKQSDSSVHCNGGRDATTMACKRKHDTGEKNGHGDDEEDCTPTKVIKAHQ